MPEESLREIIGLAKKSRWIQIKKFIKFIIEKTLKNEAGYNLTALDVSINGKNKSKYSSLIKNKENIKEIDKISDFSHLSLYQTTQSSNNLIDLSKINGTIIVLAKYLGPLVEDHQVFDFSIHLDTIDEPFFTVGSGRKINGSEILEIINKNTKPISKTKKDILKKKSKQVKDPKINNLEAFVFEKLTNKKAIWNGSETKFFQNWKTKIKNKYRIETGKIVYYKGKPTKQFSLYLENLINKRPIKNTKPISKTKKDILKKKSKQVKDPEITNLEAFVFEKLTNKKAIWNGSETKFFQNWKIKIKNKYQIETGKIVYYKGKPTKQFSLYLENLINNKKKPIKNKKLIKKFDKNASNSKKQSKEALEKKIFKTLTGKNAIWNESETKNFKDWKNRLYKKYGKDTGRNAYYKGNLTQSYKKYLKNLIKSN
ncbi:MAG: hypothetical protein KAW66_00850 [Candidatus Lokiarchaeota archaeon]|nr:hypothetical protein [Candidatus Lokiarchaeota archaeon]